MSPQTRLWMGTNRVLERSPGSALRLLSGNTSLINDLSSFSGKSALRHRGYSALAQARHRNAVLFASGLVRTLSSNGPQGPVTAASEKASSLGAPPVNTAKSKAKIELRPGPIKSQTLGTHGKQPTVPSSSVKPHPTKPPPPNSEEPLEKTEKVLLQEQASSGITEIAKKDIQDAAQHGVLLPPPEGASWAGRLFHQAKELFKFYLRGMKLVISHRKLAKELLSRSKRDGTPLSWRDYRFVQNNNSDLAKLVPFVLIILVIEEIIPLIVMYVPGMLPSTCVLPSQRARIAASRHERQRAAHGLAHTMGLFNNVTPEQTIDLVHLNSDQLKTLCSAIGVSSKVLPRYTLSRRLRLIAEEDALLARERSLADLTPDEITGALWDRGLLADTYDSKQQLQKLRWWLDSLTTSNGISHANMRASLLVRILKGGVGL